MCTRSYTHRFPGFFRMNVCGWRFVVIDRTKCRPLYSDRTYGLHVGRFIVRLHFIGA